MTHSKRNRKTLWRQELEKRYSKLEKEVQEFSFCLTEISKEEDLHLRNLEEEMDTIDHVICCTGDFYDAVVEHMIENHIAEIVDIGCANGHQAEAFLQNGFLYTGIECCSYLTMWKPEQVSYLFQTYPFEMSPVKSLGCSSLCYGYFIHDYEALARQFEIVILDNMNDKKEIEKHFEISTLKEECFFPEEKVRTIYLLKRKERNL